MSERHSTFGGMKQLIISAILVLASIVCQAQRSDVPYPIDTAKLYDLKTQAHTDTPYVASALFYVHDKVAYIYIKGERNSTILRVTSYLGATEDGRISAKSYMASDQEGTKYGLILTFLGRDILASIGLVKDNKLLIFNIAE